MKKKIYAHKYLDYFKNKVNKMKNITYHAIVIVPKYNN